MQPLKLAEVVSAMVSGALVRLRKGSQLGQPWERTR
jgi:hypothetical protein